VGIPIGVAGVITIAYASIDQILVFEIAGEAEAGLYGAAYRLLEQAHFIPISFMTTLFPIIAAAYPADMASVRSVVQSTADYLAMASLPMLAFAIAAAEPLIRVLFGEEFERAAPALPVLMGAFVLIAFGYLAGNLIVVLNLQRVFVNFALIALVFNVVLNLVLIPPYGFMAAAWVTLATEALVLTLSARVVLSRLEMSVAVGRALRTLTAAAMMGVAVFASENADAPLWLLVLVAGVTYPLLLLLFRVVRRDELLDLIRRRAPEGTRA
jgi:O-antigen/teichoic acid export membrane protein